MNRYGIKQFANGLIHITFSLSSFFSSLSLSYFFLTLSDLLLCVTKNKEVGVTCCCLSLIIRWRVWKRRQILRIFFSLLSLHLLISIFIPKGCLSDWGDDVEIFFSAFGTMQVQKKGRRGGGRKEEWWSTKRIGYLKIRHSFNEEKRKKRARERKRERAKEGEEKDSLITISVRQRWKIWWKRQLHGIEKEKKKKGEINLSGERKKRREAEKNRRQKEDEKDEMREGDKWSLLSHSLYSLLLSLSRLFLLQLIHFPSSGFYYCSHPLSSSSFTIVNFA